MVQPKFAHLNGIRLHYVTAGSGPLLLFLHGFPDFWYLWKHQLAHFQHHYRVVAPDLRGYNLSDKPAEVARYRLPILVEDMRALIDHLEQKPLAVIGHDWGAAVAWELAAVYPTYLDKLIALSVAPLDILRQALRDPDIRQAWAYQLMVSSPQAEQILQAGDYHLFTQTVFGANVQVSDYAFTTADRVAYRQAWSQPGAITGGVNYYRAARLMAYFTEADRQAFLDSWNQPDRAIGGEQFFVGLTPSDLFGPTGEPPDDDRLDDVIGNPIVMPTLLLAGEHEAFDLIDRFDWFETRVLNGTMLRIPNTGHRLIHERPDRVTAHLQAFIE
ncbi:MAG: alpha/beta hydrolase [Anaerolineae bacterium]|nr:alpha/beta hydrolase [Anaerolineae bacterium]